MSKKHPIICIGEVLWDHLPDGLFLGGAPLNVCYHLKRMGIDSGIISRVGDDELGKKALGQIFEKGIDTSLIQIDQGFPTGIVAVELDEEGNPCYEIVEPVAWDQIRLDEIPQNSITTVGGLVFGSLAQRCEESRKTIQSLLLSDCVKIFDMNLRPPHDNKKIVETSLQASHIVKMNQEELKTVINWFSLPGSLRKASEALAEKFNCSIVCITRGNEGAVLFHEGEWSEHSGYQIKVKDAVGAGDAFLAALIHGIINGKQGIDLLAQANAAGAFIAQKDGAMPDYSLDVIFPS